jgi:poly(hydroxyalkanoate) depolymerase family esterase
MIKVTGGAPDMARVMELVRAGRPAEATALLQGRAADGASTFDSALAGLASPVPRGRQAMPTAQRRVWSGRAADTSPAMPRAHVVTPDGRRDYALFVPQAVRAKPALVVMLHGCTQNPEDFARGTGMNHVAAREGLHVLWPEQGRAFNPMGCWNWFEPDHQSRGAGEPAQIVAMIDAVSRDHGIAPGRVFVAGLSAGGAMAAVLAAEYPERFAAAGVHSGLPAGAARSMPDAMAAMRSGGKAKRVRRTASAAVPVPVIVFHGDADATVSPRNGAALAASIGDSARTGGTTAGRAWSRTSGAAGEFWVIQGLGHAWSGGSASGSHADPAGPDATAEMVRFFLERVGDAAVIEAVAV